MTELFNTNTSFFKFQSFRLTTVAILIYYIKESLQNVEDNKKYKIMKNKYNCSFQYIVGP